MKKGWRCYNCSKYFRNIPKPEHDRKTCYGRACPPDNCGKMICVLM